MPQTKIKPSLDVKAALVKAVGLFIPAPKSPDKVLGQLFIDVQRQKVYEDGMTFVNVVPRSKIKHIQQEYKIAKDQQDFNLQEFVNNHFYSLDSAQDAYITNPDHSMREHILGLWSVLERRNLKQKGSLLALPHSYIVPGGRFSEQFYWDSYFIMLGLAADNRWGIIEGMMKNYTYMIRKFGFIPTANRTYYLSRSQPPFFSHMVDLLAKHKGALVYIEYLPYLLAEHNFWMNGRAKLTEGSEVSAFRRLVRMPNGALLNRYFDDEITPRPESYHEDVSTVEYHANQDPQSAYIHLRAAAESGWDFSSRWLSDPTDLRTIETTNIVPVDLNSLLYHLEVTIAKAYRLLKNVAARRRFELYAERRAKAMNEYFWDDEERFFVDYHLVKQEMNDSLTLASVFPLYVGTATTRQAAAVANKLESDFLQKGGLITTLVSSGQQWDSPNAWAPLQWVAIQGLRNYGYNDLANEVKLRWLQVNQSVFASKGKMIEKYDALSDSGIGGGGEYPVQDGFGWTNGVAAALSDEIE